VQRKITKQSRGANSSEKRFILWIKSRGICAACDNDGGVICHHIYGSSYRINKILVGHWAVLGLCQMCDNVITRNSPKVFEAQFGKQSDLWMLQIEQYPLIEECQQEAYEAIVSQGFGRG
jgi:hypothetical protein